MVKMVLKVTLITDLTVLSPISVRNVYTNLVSDLNIPSNLLRYLFTV